jgi:hypothetical protein
MQTATIQSTAPMSGSLSLDIRRGGPREPEKVSLRKILRQAMPNTGNREIDAYRFRNMPNVLRGLGTIAIARKVGAPTFFGVVSHTITRASGEVVDLGVVSCRVVTTTGCGFIVDAFQNLVELENMKYHGFGTGSNAESSANTPLHTELTTEYATNNTRPTGTTTEASATVYRTVATLSPDASVSITEHGIFDQASNAGGVLLDKSLFTAIALVSGDSLATTYDLTFTAGS